MQLRDCIPDWKKQEVTVMIIKRKFELFGILYENDPDSKAVIDSALDAYHSAQEKKHILEGDSGAIPAYFDMGCGIAGGAYKQIIKGLDKLDNKKPYDNGLSVGDTTSVEHELSQDGKRLQLRLVKQVYDDPYRIVGLVVLSSEEGKAVITDGWDMKLLPPGYDY